MKSHTPPAKKVFLQTLKLLIIFYILICIGLYFFQEKLIFLPGTLDAHHRFSFVQPFEEFNIKTASGESLNGLLFKSDTAKGLIVYLHGNGGSLDSWGHTAKTYTDLGYDLFMLDYPGYGKSEGAIHSKAQLFEAVQAAYEEMKKEFREDSIIVLGYSIGTGLAAHLAATNHPKLLILQAPYYSMTDMMRRRYPFVPTFLLKYTFQTNEYLKECQMPVVIFHGDEDAVINYASSVKLMQEIKPSDTLITLKGQGHNNMSENADYQSALEKILGR